MTDRAEGLRKLIARAICAETCAFYGDPPCWRMAEDEGVEWEPGTCDDVSCDALAAASVRALSEEE